MVSHGVFDGGHIPCGIVDAVHDAIRSMKFSIAAGTVPGKILETTSQAEISNGLAVFHQVCVQWMEKVFHGLPFHCVGTEPAAAGVFVRKNDRHPFLRVVLFEKSVRGRRHDRAALDVFSRFVAGP